MNLKIGDIYEIDTRNVYPNPPYGGALMTERIVGFDNFQVFCDSRWSNVVEGWSLDKYFKTTCIFSRMPISIVEKYGKLIRHEVIDSNVLDVIRPDLPLQIGRIQNLCWNDEIFNDWNNFSEKINLLEPNHLFYSLEADKIYIEPYNKNGTPKSAVLVEAENGQFFTLKELLWKAQLIRSEVNTSESKGIGIFRSGIKKKLPVYYIGEYCDLAGFYCTSRE